MNCQAKNKEISMENVTERVKKFTTETPDQELDDAFNRMFIDFSQMQPELNLEKIKMIRQIREIRNQSRINRRLVRATWALVFVTWILGIIQLVVR